MALDGPGLFENDFANAFVDGVEREGVGAVERVFREVLDEDYVDVDPAAEAWVAAELVAARAGQPRQRTGDEPDSYDGAIASLPIDPALLDEALRVVERLDSVDDNEMAGLLEDAGQHSAFQKQLNDLRVRLRRAGAT